MYVFVHYNQLDLNGWLFLLRNTNIFICFCKIDHFHPSILLDVLNYFFHSTVGLVLLSLMNMSNLIYSHKKIISQRFLSSVSCHYSALCKAILIFRYSCFSSWHCITSIQLRQTCISKKNPLWTTVYKSLFLHCQQDWTFAEGHHFPKWCRAGKSHRKYLI